MTTIIQNIARSFCGHPIAQLEAQVQVLKTQNRELGTEIRKFQTEIRELNKQLEQPPKPNIAILTMPSTLVDTEVRDLGLKLMYPCLLDYGQDYYYTNEAGWAEVFHYIYTEFNMPPYLATRQDCEDFSILLKGLVSALFGLNYFALTIGLIPEGTHGFNFFRTDCGIMLIEPQTAEFFDWGERKYEPEWALL